MRGAPATPSGLRPFGAEPATQSQAEPLVPSAGRLQSAIDRGKAQGKSALYFGCWDGPGHYLHQPSGRHIWDAQRNVLDFPWSDSLIDAGLLRNGKREDVCDGRVFWTAGGLAFWYAFFWWDRSVDKRGACNSGFYVRGFGWPEAQEAFEYACTQFPAVVSRQQHKLVLQDLPPAQGMSAGTAKTAKRVEGEARQPGAEGMRPDDSPKGEKDVSDV